MKYFIRAVKYFFYFCLVFALIIGVMMLLGLTDTKNPAELFKENSWWKILLIFIAAGAIYPSVGYIRKDACFGGGLAANRDVIKKTVEELGYRLEKESAEEMSFRCRGGWQRATRQWEDRIILTRNLTGASVEGIRKDVVRIVMHIEHALSSAENAND